MVGGGFWESQPAIWETMPLQIVVLSMTSCAAKEWEWFTIHEFAGNPSMLPSVNTLYSWPPGDVTLKRSVFIRA